MDEIERTLKKTPLYPIWKQVGIKSHKGIALPLSALHTKNSSGIGEFYDLIDLMDFCQKVHIDTLQLLPINDTGLDPSPYNAESGRALHPVYLSLHKLPRVSLYPELNKKITDLKALNRTSRVDYQSVLKQKLSFFSLYVERELPTLIKDPKFLRFTQENPWTRPYSLFKVLRNKNSSSHFSLWPEEKTFLTKSQFEQLFKIHDQECLFHMALQYLCYLQLKEVKKEAQKRSILLKGDIPILISPDSADVWSEPGLFDLSLSIGAPPDRYNKKGQYWGFPKPDVQAMRAAGFLWWKQRLSYASHFYDLYRIDHTVGLFRLWSIESGRPSVEGRFAPLTPTKWKPLGQELLRVFIEASDMLPIAEDLGSIPRFMRPTLQKLGICSTFLMRWELDDLTHFKDPKLYSSISMTCVSTHDSTTLEQWWKQEPKEAKKYAKSRGWNYHPTLSQEQRRSLLQESLNSASLFHINLFSEYLALIPELVHEDPNEERINVPGTIAKSNWTYRFKQSLEYIASHPEFTSLMQELFS